MAYKITILTGAGISAASSIPTFRDNDGLWMAADPDEVASANAYARNPTKVLEFFNDRRRDMKGKKPNEGHLAIAALQARPDVECRVITQNIDNLHELAGTKDVLHIHGEIFKRTCAECGFIGSIYPKTSKLMMNALSVLSIGIYAPMWCCSGKHLSDFLDQPPILSPG